VAGNGGAGVVYVRSQTPAQAVTGSPTVVTYPGIYIYQFNSSGTIRF
jgi:hypothetical protein